MEKKEDSIHKVFDETVDMNELAQNEEQESHISLRPKTFDEYPGQESVCENLKVYTQAAKMRGRMLDHCLLHGPPGLGKTTLAGIIAHELDCQIKITSGPLVEKVADLMGLLASLESRTVLFIDEIHRLPVNVEETLYSAMEDRRLDVIVGQGPAARSVQFDLPAFCVIGATTRAGSLSPPLRDRFGIVEHLTYYSPKALTQIILRSASIFNIKIQSDAAGELARRSRGTPRISNQLLRRVMDFALVENVSPITLDIVKKSLGYLGVDSEGLSRMDREYMRIIRDRYSCGPAGIESISAALNEERSTLEDVYEPFLVYKGFISRGSRGRLLTRLGKDHLSSLET